MKHLFAVLLLAPTVFATRAQAPAQAAPASASAELSMLRLYDGGILWGQITGHDAQTLHVLRLDNGGAVRLPWTRLDPSLADELLAKYGYVDRSGDEVFVEADRLFLQDGTDVIGQIVNRTASELWVKTAQRTFPVAMKQLRGAAVRVQAPALDIYTRDELYQSELVRLDATSAQSLWDFSVYCERIYDFAHAVEQLEALAKLEPGFKTNEVANALTRNRCKAQNQAALDTLREIDQDRARGYFDRALAKIEAFVAANPNSGFVQDAQKKKASVEKAREAKLRERASEAWISWTSRLIAAKARDPQLTQEAAIEWLEEGLDKSLVDAVAGELTRSVSASITPELVTRFWKERAGGRWRRASYGQGTFLLGDAEARKGLNGTTTPESQAAPTSETDSARRELEERLKRYVAAQETARAARAATAEGEDNENEKFWKEYGSTNRAQWMLAYHVEHSGDYQLRDPQFSNCPDCGGGGRREVLNAVGQANRGGQGGGSTPASSAGRTQLVDCPACHAVGIIRRVSYR
ncbi:MAG: hypothetical protein NTV21_06420 [Planctomycetota bacterium]|nr:hypothetical protein [Planctomycetota bacterium]